MLLNGGYQATADALVTSRIFCASLGVLQFAVDLPNISSILKARFLASFRSEADDISLTIRSAHSVLLAGAFITGASDATAIHNHSSVSQDAHCTICSFEQLRVARLLLGYTSYASPDIIIR